MVCSSVIGKEWDLATRSIIWELPQKTPFFGENSYLCHPKNRSVHSCSYCPQGSKSASPERSRQQGIIEKGITMPKVKTNSSAKKRFKVTGTGKITFQKAYKRHILTKKSKKRKRVMNKKGQVSAANLDFVKRLLRLR